MKVTPYGADGRPDEPPFRPDKEIRTKWPRHAPSTIRADMIVALSICLFLGFIFSSRMQK